MAKVERNRCVVQEWVWELPMQQQTVLLGGCVRGPDGIEKRHGSKALIRVMRTHILNAALFGRALDLGDKHGSGSYMVLPFMLEDPGHWLQVCDAFFDVIDGLPHHFIAHVEHAVEIMGYKHPNDEWRHRYLELYLRFCEDRHHPPESEADMDERLGDWGKKEW